MHVCFVMDRIPSYILVITRKLNTDEEHEEARKKGQKYSPGKVFFRIISLQVTSKAQEMEHDKQVLDTISELSRNEKEGANHSRSILELSPFHEAKNELNNLNQNAGGCVPTVNADSVKNKSTNDPNKAGKREVDVKPTYKKDQKSGDVA